jgi:hypothetical protein
MSQRSRRGKRRQPGKDVSLPAAAEPQSQDRYQKFLPEWMRGNAARPVPLRPSRPRRPRAPRSVGGYTPGKFAVGE